MKFLFSLLILFLAISPARAAKVCRKNSWAAANGAVLQTAASSPCLPADDAISPAPQPRLVSYQCSMHLEHAEDGSFGIRERLDFTVSLDPASEVTYFHQFPSENFTADIGVDADRKLFLFSLQNREGTTWYPPQVAADFDAKRIRLAGAVLQNSRYGNSFVVLHCDRSN